MSMELLGGYWQALLDLIFPPRCEVCGDLGQPALCPLCHDRMVLALPPYCACCGEVLVRHAHESGFCAKCQAHPPAYRGARAAGWHVGTLREAILQFKFHNRRRLAEPLGEILAERFRAEADQPFSLAWQEVTALVPVPLHPKRRAWRGFDQALMLCHEMSRRLDLPVLSDSLVRTRCTTPQVELTPTQRQENVRGAFAVRSLALRGQRVLLIDDVTTTGATLEQAARALRSGGAAEVYALTLSRPLPGWHPAAGGQNEEMRAGR